MPTYLEAKLDDRGRTGEARAAVLGLPATSTASSSVPHPQLVNGALQSEIKVESVEFNVPIDDALFRMPKGSSHLVKRLAVICL